MYKAGSALLSHEYHDEPSAWLSHSDDGNKLDGKLVWILGDGKVEMYTWSSLALKHRSLFCDTCVDVHQGF